MNRMQLTMLILTIAIMMGTGIAISQDAINFSAPRSQYYFLKSTAPPCHISTTTTVMAGGPTSFTPKITGNASITINFEVQVPLNTTVNLSSQYQFAWGTGSGPLCASAVAGTAVGQQFVVEFTNPVVTNVYQFPFSETVVLNNLTLGTTIWTELQVTDSSTATWIYSLRQITVVEA